MKLLYRIVHSLSAFAQVVSVLYAAKVLVRVIESHNVRVSILLEMLYLPGWNIMLIATLLAIIAFLNENYVDLSGDIIAVMHSAIILSAAIYASAVLPIWGAPRPISWIGVIGNVGAVLLLFSCVVGQFKSRSPASL